MNFLLATETPSNGWLIPVKLLAVIVLVLANGFFVAAEFALVAMRRSRVEQLLEEGHPRARYLQRAVGSLDVYLAATQLGITMSSLGLGWIGEPALAALFEPAFHAFLPPPFASIGAHTLSVAIAFSIITSLHIVLGELAPKSLALQRPEATAIYVVQLLELYLAIFRPVIQVLNNLGNFVLRRLGLESGGSEELIHSPEEIRLLVAASRQAGVVGEIQEDVIERVFDLEVRRISAFMTPRRAVVWLDIEDSIATLQKIVIESVHSHFPVCQGSIDELIGFITAKQLLAASLNGELTIGGLAKLVSPPLYVPENSRVASVLEQFKSSGKHTAVIVDEYGAIQGLVTLNDILEAIVGNIRTGNEPAEPQVIQRNDGSWLVDGMLAVEDFKDRFNIKDLPGEEGIEYQTVGGFVLSQLGHLPTVSEAFEWDRLYVEVVDMDEHRVDKVLVRWLPDSVE